MGWAGGCCVAFPRTCFQCIVRGSAWPSPPPTCPPPHSIPAGNTDAARLAYAAGIKRCIDSVALWVAAARLEERAGNLAKARALLEQARLKNPKNPGLWLAAVRTELRGGNQKAGEALMAKALQVGWEGGQWHTREPVVGVAMVMSVEAT